ncbi:MerR family transcriptional regulator [Actinomadura sp. 9N215]|uniref:MerR family transcriptional regulator n=1 Tax=Actinomadura sp. 9N215 TaxID=3375150 RepID=UPI0037B90FB3
MDERAVTIGEAAALYGLTPSTLRWWEGQGLLDPPARAGGKRLYRDADLRRIGLIYLCCVTGLMPLDEAAAVTSGDTDRRTWRRTIARHIARLEQLIEQTDAARNFLSHLLRCEADDMAACPVLDGELAARTPRGRVHDTDLVHAAAVARAGPVRSPATPRRDEKPGTGGTRDENAHPRCPGCGQTVARHARGRPRVYCSRACQQRAYRTRRPGRRPA